MSKVIHLADDAHRTAKRFCKQHGLRMSDWVATLVDEAIANRVQAQAPAPAKKKKKKVLEKLSSKPQADDAPPWEQPPFWKARGRRN